MSSEIKSPRGGLRERNYHIGLDIHKRVIACCIKRIDDELVRQGFVAADRKALMKWLAEPAGPLYGAMEATIFTGWEYGFLKPRALELKRLTRPR